MHEENIKTKKKASGIRWAFVFAVAAIMLFGAFNVPLPKNKDFHENPEDDGSVEYMIWESLFGSTARADFDATGSGIESFFLLDYGQTPTAVLNNNATDWSSSPNVHYYASASGFSGEVPASDPFYFCVRGKYNDSIYHDGDFNESRIRCRLQCSGDESVDIYESNNSATAGDWVFSAQDDTGTKFIWGVYFWDDGVDGYRITSSGTIDSITATWQSLYS